MYKVNDRVTIKSKEELLNDGVSADDNIINYAGVTTVIKGVDTSDDTITLYNVTMYDLTEMNLVDADIERKV